jgi:hypothetical protein
MLCSGSIATASWVASSTTTRHLIERPVATRSNTKSIDQTSLARAGRTSGCRSLTGIFLRRRRLTCRPSSAYSRSTRLWFTRSPPWRSFR